MGELAPWDVETLSRAWREATPFSHVVIDGLVPDARLGELAAAFDDEPADEIHDEIFSMMASAKTPEHPAFRALTADLSRPEVLESVAAITGARVSRVELRAFVYLPGHYLLPHADHQAEVGRSIAIAFYVDARELEGGELELFECVVDGGEIVATRAAKRVDVAPNRAVLFEVSDRSLHQVREVTKGARLSLAGWFYP